MDARQRAAERLVWWRDQVHQLRQGPLASGYQSARVALAEAMEQLAGRTLRSYRRGLGDEFDDVVRDKIWGRSPGEPPAAEARPEAAPVSSRDGLLQVLERRAVDVEQPAAFCRLALERALISAGRRRHRLVEADPTSEGKPPDAPTARAGMVRAELDDGGSSLRGETHEAALLSVPRSVERTLRDAVQFAAVAMEIAPRLPAEHPLRRLHESRRLPAPRTVERWYGAAEVLSADIEALRDRPRWTHEPGGPTVQAYPRAWQARYYTDAGAVDFTSPDEVPGEDRATARSLFYKHLSRFRQDFDSCSAVGLDVVERAARLPSGLLQADDGRRRLPCAWDPAQHPSLEA